MHLDQRTVARYATDSPAANRGQDTPVRGLYLSLANLTTLLRRGD
jgi:hypothetical protein